MRSLRWVGGEKWVGPGRGHCACRGAGSARRGKGTCGARGGRTGPPQEACNALLQAPSPSPNPNPNPSTTPEPQPLENLALALALAPALALTLTLTLTLTRRGAVP